jgi:hypothetical protein
VKKGAQAGFPAQNRGMVRVFRAALKNPLVTRALTCFLTPRRGRPFGPCAPCQTAFLPDF